jgi:hypothetical protein
LQVQIHCQAVGAGEVGMGVPDGQEACYLVEAYCCSEAVGGAGAEGVAKGTHVGLREAGYGREAGVGRGAFLFLQTRFQRLNVGTAHYAGYLTG